MSIAGALDSGLLIGEDSERKPDARAITRKLFLAAIRCSNATCLRFARSTDVPSIPASCVGIVLGTFGIQLDGRLISIDGDFIF